MIDGSPVDTWHHKKRPIEDFALIAIGWPTMFAIEGITRSSDRHRTVAIVRDFWKRVESSGASDLHHADA